MELATTLETVSTALMAEKEMLVYYNELAEEIENIVEKGRSQVDELKRSRVKLTSIAKVALNDVREAASLGYQFIDCVDDLARCCQDEGRISRVQAAIRNSDVEPLRNLLEQMKRCLVRAEEKYQEFETACKNVSRNCVQAAEECKYKAIEAETKRTSSLAAGGVVTIATVASVAAGAFTFGAGTVVGLALTAAAGGTTAAVTLYAASEYADLASKFRSLGSTFDELTDAADRFLDEVRILRTAVVQVGREVDQVDHSWHTLLGWFKRRFGRTRHVQESICDSLDLLNERAKSMYSETSVRRNALKNKKDDLERRLSSL